MKTSRAGLFTLLLLAPVLPLGCGTSGPAVSYDGSVPLADALLGSSGGLPGGGGTSVVGVGGTGGVAVGTGGCNLCPAGGCS